MTARNFPKLLISVVSALAIIVSAGAIASIALAPDVAYAKNDKGKGGGKGGGNGRGKSGNHGKGAKADKDKDKGQRNSKSTKGNGSWLKFKDKKGGQKRRTSKARSDKSQSTSLAGFGQAFKRDVQGLFGKRDRKQTKHETYRKTTYSKRDTHVSPKRSLRPVARDVYGAPAYEDRKYEDRKRKHRHYRDPLVAAISDPYGSDKLRNLSASNAAAPAFRNAAAHSNVGRIATYQAEAAEYYDLRDDLYGARHDLRALNESYDGRSSEEIADDIETLQPDDPEYAEKLDALEDELADAEAYEEARDDLRDDVRDLKHETHYALQDAEAAFFDASKGGTLTRDALGEFHGNLGLPQPKDRYGDDVTIQPLPDDPEYPVHTDHMRYRDDDAPVAYRYDAPAYEDRKYEDRKRKHRHYRDPLVAAITDPYGSDKLRNLSASNAAAPAFRNAAAHSNVGRIATYQAEAAEYYDLRDDLYDARHDLRALNESYDGRSSEEIADDIEALQPDDPEYAEKLDALEDELADAEAYEEARDDLRDDVRDIRHDTVVALKEAEYAFFQASKDTTLTQGSLAELHENLELPSPTD